MKKIYSTKVVTIFKEDLRYYTKHRDRLQRRLEEETGFKGLEVFDCVEAGIFVHVTVKGYKVSPERKWSKSMQIARRMKRLLND